jgi:hypothetical protein
MNDDEYGTLLLRPLAGEPAGPPLIDVARAMREGRRMRRRRWAFGGGFLAVFTATLVTGSLLIAPATPHKPVLPPDPPLPKSCTLAALPTGRYHSAEVVGGDSTGRWHFGQSNPQANTGTQHTLVWHDGALAGDAAQPGTEVNLRAINSSGVIVGEVNDKKTGIRPYVYRNGKFSPLKGGVGEALAINDDGTIVGRLGSDTHPVLVRWRSADAEPEPLRIPEGSPIAMYNLAIGPDGTVAGVVILPLAPGATFAETATYLWLPDGTTRRITAPPPARDTLSALNPLTFRNGWLYAEQVLSDRSDNTPVIAGIQLVRYDPASGTWQKIGGDRFTDGPQLPSSGRSFLHAGTIRPRVYVGTAVLDLPLTMPLADPEVDNAMLQSISDDAHTVTGVLSRGGSGDPSQPDRPVIWRCG